MKVDPLRTDDAIPKDTQHKLSAVGSPLDEARDLYWMMSSGFYSLNSVRELIAVPYEIKSALGDYAENFPKGAGGEIHRILQFRQRVAEEFEKLLKSK
jgi:hypothetical protein